MTAEPIRYCTKCRKVLTRGFAHCQHPQCPWCGACHSRMVEAAKRRSA